MNKLELTASIKKEALNLGFSLVGIAPAKKHSKDSLRLDSWLRNNCHANMHWIAKRKDERSNIFNYYPEAKSIISLATNYFTGNADSSHNVGKISNYAWGDDYHDIIKKRLYQLLSFIQENKSDIEGIVSVDTTPVLERAWAQRSGLGWIGKHTNLISPEYGSWVFLSELIVNYEFDYDNQFAQDLCGSCVACLEACPTQAIEEPYKVNSNKCISYLTIEHRDKIPQEFEDKLDDWIYGCDICQEVCPWNHKNEEETTDSHFEPRENLQHRSMDEWLKLTEDEFRTLFKKSAVKRTKYSGLKRNIKLLSKD